MHYELVQLLQKSGPGGSVVRGEQLHHARDYLLLIVGLV